VKLAAIVACASVIACASLIACGGDSASPRGGSGANGASGSGGVATVTSRVPVPVSGVPVAPTAPPPLAGRTLDLTLRSSPPGANAAVDGIPVGATPTHHSIEADGREHTFTFDLPHYVFRKYRFVPVQSGVIHARLEPVPTADEPDSSDSNDVVQPAPDDPPPAPPVAPPASPTHPTVVSPSPSRVGPQP
jgi:hypothetical protein